MAGLLDSIDLQNPILGGMLNPAANPWGDQQPQQVPQLQYGGRRGGAQALAGILSNMFAPSAGGWQPGDPQPVGGAGMNWMAAAPGAQQPQMAAPAPAPVAPPMPQTNSLLAANRYTPDAVMRALAFDKTPLDRPGPAPVAASPDVNGQTQQPTTSKRNAEGYLIDAGGNPVGTRTSLNNEPAGMPAPISGPMNIAPTSALGRVSGGSPDAGQRLMAAIMGFTHGGALIPAIGNAIGGGVTGQRQDKEGRVQEGLAETYRALVDSGIAPPQALAAVAAMQAGDPSLLHATAEQFGLPKVQQTGQGYGDVKQFGIPSGTAMNPIIQSPQTLSPQQATIARQPEAFQRQMFFRGHGPIYQQPDGHVLKRMPDGRVIDQMTGQEVRG